MSVQESTEPFAPLGLSPSFVHFREIAEDPFLRRVLLDTVLLGAGVTVACAVLGYPVALWLTGLSAPWRPWGFALVLVPLLTNVVVRSLGIILLLSPTGVVATAVQWLGLPRPDLLFGWFAVGLALTQVFLPYMVRSLFDALDGQDRRVAEAGRGLGATPAATFLAVRLPLSVPGLRAGLVLVFLLSSTSYVSATLVGGRKLWIAGMVVFREGLENLNVPLASALATVMLAVSVLATLAIGRVARAAMPWLRDRPAPRRSSWLRMAGLLAPVLEAIRPVLSRLLFALALTILVFPLILVAVASVNDTPQATVAAFRGFTWRWYAMLAEDLRYLRDALNSLALALATVVCGLAIALPAAFALARARFRWRELLGAAFLLPLALPGLAVGLGMLRLLQWLTAVPAFVGLLAVHVVLVAPFLLILLRASVATLDRTVEEAARGLGADPIRTFLRVVLPQLAPGIAVASILGFLISFGEVTVTAFLTTARLQTLPVRIYAEASFSLENTVNALSTLTILLTVALLVLLNRVVPLDRVWRR